MKKFGWFRLTIYKWSIWIYITCTSVATGLGFISDLDQTTSWLQNRPILWGLIERIQDFSIWLYILIIILITVCLIVEKLGNPWVWEKLQFILDEYQSKVFEGNNSDPNDYHRVTLFQHKKHCIFRKHWSANRWYKPSGKNPMIGDYLIPVLRSGHISQKSNALFFASDCGDEAEGIVGQAWARKNVVVVPELPELHPVRPTNRKKYAEATFISREMVDHSLTNKKPLPRSIAAIPVEVNGSLWGVVVLDSRVPNSISNDSVNNYELTVALIGQLLEKA